MSDQELHDVITRWEATGIITPTEQAYLRERYFADIGSKPGCTTCPDFWWDVRIHYLLYLKTINLPVTVKNRKYMIKDNGSLRLFGESVLYVNEGVNSESIKVLTDEDAERMLKNDPDLKESIVKNPAYKEPESEGAKPAASGARRTRQATTKPADETAKEVVVDPVKTQPVSESTNSEKPE